MSETIDRHQAETTTDETGTDKAIALVKSSGSLIIAADKDGLLEELAADLREFNADVSTPAGEKAIASMGARISKVKVAIMKAGDKTVEEARAIVQGMVKEKKLFEERMDGLRDAVKAQLDEYRAIERRRKDEHETALADIERLGNQIPEDVAGIEASIEAFNALVGREWQEFKRRATEATVITRDRLQSALTAANRRAAEAAELAELRHRAAEGERKDAHRAAIKRITDMATFAAGAGSGPEGAFTAADVSIRIGILKRAADHDWQEFASEAAAARTDTLARLQAVHDEIAAREASERQARETEIAAAAAEAARKQAEEAAAEAMRESQQREEQARQQAADAAAREAEQEQRRREFVQRRLDVLMVTKDVQPGDEASLQAVDDLIRRAWTIFDETDWNDRLEEATAAYTAATANLKNARATVEQRLEREQAAAAAEEARRREARETEIARKAAEQQQALADETAAEAKRQADEREANVAHRKKINGGAVTALLKACKATGLSVDVPEEDMTTLMQAVVTAIAKRQVPAVTIAY